MTAPGATPRTDAELDALIEPILKAAGTSLRNYSLHMAREGMRDAMRTALAIPISDEYRWEMVEGPNYTSRTMFVPIDTTAVYTKRDGKHYFKLTLPPLPEAPK